MSNAGLILESILTMKSKILFQSDGNSYLQDVTNNLMLYLPRELLKQIEKRLNNSNSSIFGNSTYYERKADFLLEKLSDQRNVEESFSGRLSPEMVENTFANTRQITFELTERCNLHCKYCAYGELYGDYLPRQNKDLPWAFVDQLIEYMCKYWASSRYASVYKSIAVGFYGGEPLLKMDLINQIVRLLKEKSTNSLGFRYNMTTNGILLNQYMDFLVENDVQLLISLDGDECGNSYRVTKAGKNPFHKIVSNVMLLKESFPEYFKERVMFASVLHNKNSVSGIKNFFRKQFDKEARISEVNPVGIKYEKKEQFNSMYRNTMVSLNQAEDYDKIKEDMFVNDPDTNTLMYYLHTYSGNCIKNYRGFFIEKETERWLPTGTCMPFGKRIFLTAAGKILPCERIGHQYSLGYVDQDGVNIDFREIANRYNQYYDNLQSQCSACYHLKHCLQCIFQLDGIENKPVCNGYFNETRFQKYLSENIAFLCNNSKLYKKIMDEVILEE